jgi:type II secretory ATPase GspE/PulE/Tfp pilus assembly ATPase PilB-like protein
MRLVDKSKKTPPLDVLGIEGINQEIIHRNINYPNGVILVTGPTGSGKTTTLYAALDILNHPEVNITTYEDPVEIKVAGLNQSQVRTDIGFTFAQGLRAALRQDPDIIMV